MIIEQVPLDACGPVDGLVVVIDVIRAFTTAAFAFAAGAREILPVATPAEAFRLRDLMPGALLMGEVQGHAIEGFDLDNSPSEMAGLDLNGRRLIQRTSAGTQGIVRSGEASIVLAASFVCASATAAYIRRHAPAKVVFVISGASVGRDGDEDAACADYIEALLCGETPPLAPFLKRVRDAIPGLLAAYPNAAEMPPLDLEYCMAVDRFDLAMPVLKRGDLRVMLPERNGEAANPASH